MNRLEVFSEEPSRATAPADPRMGDTRSVSRPRWKRNRGCSATAARSEPRCVEPGGKTTRLT
ncbi:hypothetical protein EYF80_015668 [Liparis tanakae]|uniref:Uncharacterized protein n=1 Tax=Liparis tanakae TaxID=230148 RepID=A0A4Z2I7K2_9TELE|nr:hypothetical protein EYF80_015668 [Liparis tanakae]